MKRAHIVSTLLFGLSLFMSPSTMLAGASVGTRSAEFLTLGAGARAEAMGQAFTAVADDGSALYWNPATNLWMPLPSVADVDNNCVTGRTNHFSLFQLMQATPVSDLSLAKAYPNPFQP